MPKYLSSAQITLLYAIFACLWIIVSGALLTFTVEDPILQGRIEMSKGLLFVVVTSGLLFLLLNAWREPINNRNTANTPETPDYAARRMVSLFIVFVLVAPLTGLVVFKLYGTEIKREAFTSLESAVQLKALQIEKWLNDRQNDSLSLHARTDFADLTKQFLQQSRNEHVAKLILENLKTLGFATTYDSILLLSPDGRLLLSLGEYADISDILQNQLHQAVTSKAIQHGNLYRHDHGHAVLDWIIPILLTDKQSAPVIATVVLRASTKKFL
ncbi:MAG: hypothetical protein ABL925_05825, partial [Methylococcales bacterium]